MCYGTDSGVQRGKPFLWCRLMSCASTFWLLLCGEWSIFLVLELQYVIALLWRETRVKSDRYCNCFSRVLEEFGLTGTALVSSWGCMILVYLE